VYLGFFNKHGWTYYRRKKYSTFCKHRFPGNTLTHSTNEDLLNIVNKYWKRWEKEANIVIGATFRYCRIYHTSADFIILNLFKVVKWTSCFILSLLRGILPLVRKLMAMHQSTQQVNKHWHGRKGWEKESNTVKGGR
jgi:hypothetical protein